MTPPSRVQVWTAALAITALTPAVAPAEDYVLDAEASEVVVLVYKAGVAARLAHDHVIVAKQLSGRLTYDPAQPLASKVSVTVQAASLSVDEPELVKKHGLPGAPSPDDRKTIHDTLISAEQLHVEKYPTITFVSTGLSKVKDDLYLSGDFTLRGVTKRVTFLVKLELQDGVLRGKGRFPVKQSDFGYEPYSAFLGAVKVKDRALISVELVARRPKPAPPAQEPQ